MKTVLLLRHGKSDWDAEWDTDHERPLARRGRKAAARIGRYLADLGQAPELVLSSSARRAADTVRLAAEAGGWSGTVETEPALYGASPEEALEAIRRCPERVGRLMLVGHEPTWSLLAGGLVGGASFKFPTAALARIDLPVPRWAEAGFGTGLLVWFVTPKLLAAIGRP